jgi:hypothetical protein
MKLAQGPNLLTKWHRLKTYCTGILKSSRNRLNPLQPEVAKPLPPPPLPPSPPAPPIPGLKHPTKSGKRKRSRKRHPTIRRTLHVHRRRLGGGHLEKVKHSFLKIILWNANGVKGKYEEIVKWIEENAPDICIITETHRDTVTNMLRARGYIQYTVAAKKIADSGHPIGGITAYVREGRNVPWIVEQEILPKEIRQTNGHRILKLSVVGLGRGREEGFDIIAVYSPQSHKTSELIVHYESLEAAKSTTMPGKGLLVLGDLNSKHPDLGSTTQNTTGNRTLKFMGADLLRIPATDSKGKQYTCTSVKRDNAILEAMRMGENLPDTWMRSCLDLILCRSTHSQRIRNAQVLRNIPAKSDHDMVALEYRLENNYIEANERFASVRQWKIRPENHEDWKAYETEVFPHITKWIEEFTQWIKNNRTMNRSDANKWYTELIEPLKQAMTKHIGNTPLKSSKNYKPTTNKSQLQKLTTYVAGNDDGATHKNEVENMEPQSSEVHQRNSDYKRKHDDGVKRMASILARETDNNPNIIWDAARQMSEHETSAPPYCIWKTEEQKDGLERQTTQTWKQAEDAWWARFKRPAPTYKTKRQVRTMEQMQTLNNQRSASNENGEWGSEPITREEVHEALKKAKKNAAPGLDRVTGRMIQKGGEVMEEAIHLYLKALFHFETTPAAFVLDCVVPVYKNKGSRYEAKSYRPVSLMSFLAKLYQAIIYTRINNHFTAESKKGNPILSDAQFGSRKGRDRLGLIYTLQGMVRLRTLQGKETYIAQGDIANAYPTASKIITDHTAWTNLDVKHKIWRTIRELERDEKGTIRINGRLTRTEFHKTGFSQGGIHAVNRFLWSVDPLFKQMDSHTPGAHIIYDGKMYRLSTLGYVDDIYILANSPEELQDALDECERAADTGGFKWCGEKTHILIANKKHIRASHTWHFANSNITPEGHMVILGEKVDKNAHRCPEQIEETFEKAERAAKALAWYGIYEDEMTPQIVEQLYIATVQSVLTAGLSVSTLTKKDWNRVFTLKANIGRKFLRAGPRASPRDVLAELGWSCPKTPIILQKIKTMIKLLNGAGGENGTQITLACIAEAQKGDDIGPIADAWHWTQLLTEGISIAELQSIPDDKLRTTTREWAKSWKENEWATESKNKNYKANRQGRFPNKYPAYYLTITSNKLQCSLKAAFRMGCAFLGGNKTSRDKTRFCRFCNTQTLENESHILLTCTGLEHERRIMWSKCPEDISMQGKAMTQPGSEQDEFATILLGALTGPPTKTRVGEIQTDVAVKLFLEQANIMLTLTHRKGLLDQTWTRQEQKSREAQEMDHWDSIQRVSKWMQRNQQ